MVLTVTRDGTAVFAQLTGQPKLQIYPLSATEFEWHAVKAFVKFSPDKEGKITKAILIPESPAGGCNNGNRNPEL